MPDDHRDGGGDGGGNQQSGGDEEEELEFGDFGFGGEVGGLDSGGGATWLGFPEPPIIHPFLCIYYYFFISFLIWRKSSGEERRKEWGVSYGSVRE